MKLQMNCMTSEKFSVTTARISGEVTMSAFASDFGAMVDGLWWLQRMDDDACDVGISIRSRRTGRVVRFFLDKQETRNGEIKAWHFAAAPEEKFCGVDLVSIWND